MEATLLASSHYLSALFDDEPLPALDEALQSACQKPYRRVDRFIQLALLGSARCVRGHELRPDCGVYMGSSLGPLTSNMRVQEQMLRARELPKPFHFVNTLGHIAGFYVADNLQLSGPCLFISRETRSLGVLVETALTDLAMGAVGQALVGVVEEAPLPLAAQRKRLQVEAGATVAEGSHWLLLEPFGPTNSQRKLTLRRYASAQQLESYLTAAMAASGAVCISRGFEPATAHAVQQRFSKAVTGEQLSLPLHASVEAAWFVGRSANDDAPGGLALIGGDDSGGGCLLHLGT